MNKAFRELLNEKLDEAIKKVSVPQEIRSEIKREARDRILSSEGFESLVSVKLQDGEKFSIDAGYFQWKRQKGMPKRMNFPGTWKICVTFDYADYKKIVSSLLDGGENENV